MFSDSLAVGVTIRISSLGFRVNGTPPLKTTAPAAWRLALVIGSENVMVMGADGEVPVAPLVGNVERTVGGAVASVVAEAELGRP